MSRAVKVFAWLWKLIWWFWSVVIVGLIVSVITALITTGLSGATDPRNWAAVHLLLAYPWPSGVALVLAALLTLCAWLAHRQQQPASPYVLKRVARLDPNIDFYVPRYVARAYLPRPADAAARDALRRAHRALALRRAAGHLHRRAAHAGQNAPRLGGHARRTHRLDPRPLGPQSARLRFPRAAWLPHRPGD